MVALSVDTVLVSPLVFALCATAHTLNYSTQVGLTLLQFTSNCVLIHL